MNKQASKATQEPVFDVAGWKTLVEANNQLKFRMERMRGKLMRILDPEMPRIVGNDYAVALTELLPSLQGILAHADADQRAKLRDELNKTIKQL